MRSILAKTLVFAATVFFCLLTMQSAVEASMVSLNDEQLSQVDGQALIEMQKVTQNGFTFYTVGLDATVKLNMNIQNMQLGCNGINGAGCDLAATNVSFGCGSADGINCYTPSSSCSASTGTTCTPTAGSVTSLLPFVLQSPFLQFAIQNDGTPATRQVAGIRLGASSVNGAFSVGSFTSFSGYMSGTTQMSLRGETNVALTTNTDFCPTGGSTPCYNANMGLADFCLTSLFGCLAYAHQYEVAYPDYSGNPAVYTAVANGRRLTAATIAGVNLDTIVNNITQNVSCVHTTSAFGCGLSNAILGLIAGSVKNQIESQLYSGLGSGVCGTTTNNVTNCNIPYNLSNVHQVQVSSNNFGLSFQDQSVQYPGYVAAAQRGWSMYMPSAFTLSIDAAMSVFTANIVTGAARAGNIVGLPGPYSNCYGATTFC